MGSYPGWWHKKGKGKRRCDICGYEYFINEGKLFKQEGLWKDKACFEALTDRQRIKQIKRR